MNHRAGRIVFCIFGSPEGAAFNRRLHDAVVYCAAHGYTPTVNWKELTDCGSPFQASLGSSRKKPVPFQGRIPYDYLLWVEPDLVFHPRQILELISRKEAIVGGTNILPDGEHIAAIRKFRPIDLLRGSSCFMPVAEIENNGDLVEVEYAGFGFLLIAKGVFESLELPWFEAQPNTGILSLTSAEVGFCRKARKQGHKIYIDPAVRVHKERKAVY